MTAGSKPAPLTTAELDAALAAAHQDLTRHVRATTDSGAALLMIMARRDRRRPGPLPASQGGRAAPADPAYGAAYITARAVALDLAGQLEKAAVGLAAASTDLQRLREGPGDPQEAVQHAAGLIAGIGAAARSAGALAGVLSGSVPVLRGAFLAEADLYVGRRIAKAVAIIDDVEDNITATRATGLALPIAHLGWEDVRAHLEAARDYLGLLLRTGLSDVSGMDLSGAALTEVNMLIGVTWTSATTWPPGIEPWARNCSREIRPGIYRIEGGGTWNPAAILVGA